MPKRDYQFWVYILSNRSHTLYIGMTNNLRGRIARHRNRDRERIPLDIRSGAWFTSSATSMCSTRSIERSN